MYIPNLNSYFIHIPKCAGTSVELFFFKMHGLDVPDKNLAAYLSLEDKNRFNWGWPYPRQKGLQWESQHITAYYCKKFGVPEFEKSDYKFTFVRNPWDRWVSEVMWQRQRIGHQRPFGVQIRAHLDAANDSLEVRHPHDAPMWKYIYDDSGNLLVDDIFKVEEMDKAEKVLSERFGRHISFGHVNRTDRKKWQEYITPEIRKALRPALELDLGLFEYE